MRNGISLGTNLVAFAQLRELNVRLPKTLILAGSLPYLICRRQLNQCLSEMGTQYLRATAAVYALASVCNLVQQKYRCSSIWEQCEVKDVQEIKS